MGYVYVHCAWTGTYFSIVAMCDIDAANDNSVVEI